MRGEGEGTWERRRRLGCAHGEGRERDWRGMKHDSRGGEGAGDAGRGIARTGRRSDPKKVAQKNSFTFVLFSCRRFYDMYLAKT